MNPASLRPQSLVVGLVFFCLLSVPQIIPQRLIAQNDTLEHTLLWRIDGNGLEHSSYLYGTFHTQDPRAFNFRDSVLPALLSCDIAAFELQMDSMLATTHQKLFYPDSVTNLRDYLTDEEFALLDERLTEELGVSAEFLQHADPSLLHLFLEEIRVPTTDEDGTQQKLSREDLRGLFRLPKETFLDAWLFRTARLEGKTVIGLETLEEQIAVMDTIPVQQRIKMLLESTEYDPAEYRALWRRLVEAYEQEDVDALYTLVEQSGSPIGVKYKLLDERNYNMVDRMIVLARQAPTFTAVGAAHLGGKFGVINLLRNKGFTVTPVLSERTGVAQEYKRPETELPWYQLTSEKSGFIIETPVPVLEFPTEARADIFDESIEYWYSTDITTGLTYMVMVRDIPFQTIISEDVEKSTKELWFGSSDAGSNALLGARSGTLMREKDVTVDGIDGKELTGIDTDGDLSRMRIFYHSGKLYLFMVSGGSSLIRSKDDSRFLKSVSFNRSALKSDWEPRTFTASYDNILNITVPGDIRFDTATRWVYGIGSFALKITGTTVDPATGTYYVIERTDIPPTAIIWQDSSLLKWPSHYVLPESAETIEEKDLTHPSWSRAARRSSYRLESGMFIQRRTYLQDGTIWSFITGTPQQEEGSTDREKFFDGIRMNRPETSSTAFSSTSQNFRIIFTGAPQLDSTTYYTSRSWTAGTWQKNQALSVNCRTYYPWFEATSEEEFFKEMQSESVDDTDSIIEERTISANGLQWREYTWKVGETDLPNMQLRERIALHGHRLYRLRSTSLDGKEIQETGDTFFNSFTLINPTPEGDIFSRKVGVLFQDLDSEDSATRAVAVNALWHYKFEEDDLQRIYKALERTYPDDTDTSSTTWNRLLDAIGNIRNPGSVDFLRAFNNNLPKNHTARQEIMEALATICTKESIACLKELLAGDLSAIIYPSSILYPLYDSISIAGALFPEMFKLASNSRWRYTVLSMTKSALDSGAITNADLQEYEEELREVTTKALDVYRKPDALTEDEEAVSPWEAVYAIDILGRLPAESETNRLLQRTLRDEEMMVKRAAATALIRRDQNVRSKWLEEIVSDRFERVNFYRDLKAMGKLDKYPAEYQSQRLLAESLVLEKVYYEDDYPPEKIAYVADRQLEWNGETVRVYLFKFRYTTYEEDETGIEDTTATWQYGFCVQPVDMDRIETDPELVQISWETFDPEKINEHFTGFIARKPEE